MSVLSTSTKSKAGAKAAKAIATRPRLLIVGAKASAPAAKLGLKASKPYANHLARRGADQIVEASRALGEAMAVHATRAVYELGLAKPPKRTAPRVAAGMVIGATAVYFLEPESGRKHRKKVAKLVS
jgi:hypothetical protein